MYKHILVTGGAGFAGSALCRALRKAFPATRITAFDNLRRRGSEWNLPGLKTAHVEFIHGDIRAMADLESVTPQPDLIIECSAEPSAQAGYGGSPDYVVQTNLMGCYHCLELARKAGADFLFISTSRVYPYRPLNELAYIEETTRYSLAADQSVAGASEYGIAETFPLGGARSLYGMTKLTAEYMVEEFRDAYGIRAIVNRFGVLTGPGQMAKSDQGVFALWVMAHLFGRKLSYIGFGGTGKQVRDFLHVDDFGALIIDQLEHFDAYEGGVWNVGGGTKNSMSLLELTALTREITGREVTMGSDPETRPADVRVYVTDHRKVSAVRGWQPQRGAVETIADIAHWYTDHRDAVKGLLL